MKYVTLSNKPEKDFTTKVKNDIIKEKSNGTFPTMKTVSTPGSDTIAKVQNKWNSEKKNTSGTLKASMLQPKPSPLSAKPAKTEQKSLYPNLQEKSKTVNLPYSIPKEKKERERLMDITGAYNLNKVNPSELQKHIRLEKKTPDDYHDVNQPYHIAKKRINEAFGPKTDFSISNYENNFDKMNKEEQSMLIYKMQKTFNKIGYTDFNGEKLKEDGVYGNKTKSVYEKYKKDNIDDYTDVLKNKQEYENFVTPDNKSSNIKYVSYNKQNDDTEGHTKTLEKKNNKENSYNFDDLVVKNSNGEPLLLASSGRDLTGLIPQESIMVAQENKKKNKITTEWEEDKLNTPRRWLESGSHDYKSNVKYTDANYTTTRIIQELINAKQKYLNAEKSGNTKEMKIQKEIADYIRAIVKMTNEFSKESGDAKFRQLVLDAEYYDKNGNNPEESISNWRQIQNYSVELAEDSNAYVDHINNSRGISYDIVKRDINMINKIYATNDNPIFYLSTETDIKNYGECELPYYYTNDTNVKKRYRMDMLPSVVDSEMGEPKDSGAGNFLKIFGYNPGGD